jgi:hypothetical protein
MKTYEGSKGVAPSFLTLAIYGGEWSDSCPGSFTPEEKAAPCPLNMRLGGPKSRSGPTEERKVLPLLGIERRPSSLQPVAIPTPSVAETIQCRKVG